MHWYTFVFLGTILTALAIIVQRKLLTPTKKQNLDPYAYTVLSLLVGSSGLFLYRILTSGYQLPNLSDAWVSVLFNVIVSTTATVFMFEGIRRLQASRFTIISSLSPFATIIAAYLILGIVPTGFQLLGGCMIIAGILAVYYHKHIWNKHYKQGMLYTVASTVLFGITLVNDKILYSHFAVLDYLPLSWLISAILLIALRPGTLAVIKHDVKADNISPVLFSIGLISIAIVLIMNGVQTASNPAVVALLQQLKIVIIGALGITLLKEKDDIGRKVFAAGLAFCGAVLVSI